MFLFFLSLRLSLFSVTPTHPRHVLLFSGATDGAVALWDLTTVLDSKSKDSWHGESAGSENWDLMYKLHTVGELVQGQMFTPLFA